MGKRLTKPHTNINGGGYMANISYITLDQLMASVESDLDSFADEGMINRGKVIKVVRRVNEDLGLKINREKQAIIEVKNHKADLPADFMYLQLAFMCGRKVEYHSNAGETLGNLTEEWDHPKGISPVVALCDPLRAGEQVNDCGGHFYVTQRWQEKIVQYNDPRPIRLTAGALKHCTDESWHHWGTRGAAEYELDIDEGTITTTFEEGTLYLNYLSDMVDDDNNVLILDHPLLTEYYEYAVKKHLLENWLLNSNADVAQRLGYVKQELRDARLTALNFVNTIEYSQIRDFYRQNRLQFAKKYYRMFSDYNDSHGRYPTYPSAYA